MTDWAMNADRQKCVPVTFRPERVPCKAQNACMDEHWHFAPP